jgi:hypothetical protein
MAAMGAPKGPVLIHGATFELVSPKANDPVPLRPTCHCRRRI